MYIAIQLEKINLESDRIIFKPVGIIKGRYDEKLRIFITQSGEEYDIMENCSYLGENYFCDPIKISKLRQRYNNKLSYMEMTEDYLADYMDIFYIGCFDYNTGTVKVTELDFYKLEKYLCDSETQFNINEVINLDNNKNQKFVFDLKALKSLKEFKTMNEVRNYVDKLISAGNYINETVQKSINNKQLEENKDFHLEWETPYSVLGIEEKEYSKDELLLVVKNCVLKIQSEDIDDANKKLKIDNVLNAYNDIIKETFQKKIALNFKNAIFFYIKRKLRSFVE